VLAYATVIYNLSKQLDIPYYTFNGWISIWLLGYVLICTFIDGTRFVRLCTHFTDEIFALLIVSIFLMDAIGDPFEPPLSQQIRGRPGLRIPHHGLFECDSRFWNNRDHFLLSRVPNIPVLLQPGHPQFLIRFRSQFVGIGLDVGETLDL
jgi:hypothetical protein